MPIKRIEKARASLPPNYQYGDAAPAVKVPHIGSDEFAAYFEAHYIQPVREMYADPVKHAAYRARVEEALNTPVEQARAKGVEILFRQFTEPTACR